MATYRSKSTGKRMSLKDAADFIGTDQLGIFAIAFRPRKGGGARSEKEILSLCMANACRTVATFYGTRAIDVMYYARHYARLAGYFVATPEFQKKLAEKIRNTENFKFFAKNANDDKQPRKAAKFKAKLTALETQLANAIQKLADTANPAPLATFYKKWGFRNKINFSTAKKIDDDKVTAAKLPARAKKSKERILVTQKTLDKYAQDCAKRWGAFGSLFFQAGREFNPKLRLDRSLAEDRTNGAPVAKNFKRRAYERQQTTAAPNAATATVNSQFIDNRTNLTASIARACRFAENWHTKNAEKAILAILEFDI